MLFGLCNAMAAAWTTPLPVTTTPTVGRLLTVLLVWHKFSTAFALDCWSRGFTADICCNLVHGRGGHPDCWAGDFTQEACCQEYYTQMVDATPCFAQIEAHEQELLQLSGSTLPGARGRPTDCLAAGHRFFWVTRSETHCDQRFHVPEMPSLAQQIHLSQKRFHQEIQQFGICVPQQCQHENYQVLLTSFIVLRYADFPSLSPRQESHGYIKRYGRLSDFRRFVGRYMATLGALPQSCTEFQEYKAPRSLLVPALMAFIVFLAWPHQEVAKRLLGVDLARIFLTVSVVGEHMLHFWNWDWSVRVRSDSPAFPVPINSGFIVLSVFLLLDSRNRPGRQQCWQRVVTLSRRSATRYLRQVPVVLCWTLVHLGISDPAALPKYLDVRIGAINDFLMCQSSGRWLASAFLIHRPLFGTNSTCANHQVFADMFWSMICFDLLLTFLHPWGVGSQPVVLSLLVASGAPGVRDFYAFVPYLPTALLGLELVAVCGYLRRFASWVSGERQADLATRALAGLLISGNTWANLHCNVRHVGQVSCFDGAALLELLCPTHYLGASSGAAPSTILGSRTHLTELLDRALAHAQHIPSLLGIALLASSSAARPCEPHRQVMDAAQGDTSTISWWAALSFNILAGHLVVLHMLLSRAPVLELSAEQVVAQGSLVILISSVLSYFAHLLVEKPVHKALSGLGW